MATDVDIVNLALRRLGCEAITALSDTSKQAKVMNELYEEVRKQVLEMFRWPFARKRVSITADATAPDFEFTARFAIPADYIMTVEEYNGTLYLREGDWFLADATQLDLIYIYDQTDETKFSPLFIKTLYLALAVEGTYSLNQDKALKAMLKEDLKEAIEDARFRASGESSPEVFEVSDFTNVRL